MPLANTGTKLPEETASALRLALLLSGAAARVTLTVYVCVVVPSCAVTTMVIALAPTTSAIAPDALPLTTVLPLTFIVAVASATVGVTVIEVTALATASAYTNVLLENTGSKLPLDTASALKLALLLAVIGATFENSEVLLLTQLFSATHLRIASHAGFPALMMMGVMSVAVMTTLLPSTLAARLVEQRPATQPFNPFSALVVTVCSPIKLMLVAVLVALVSSLKNSSR